MSSDLRSIKNARKGTLVCPKGTDELFMVLAKFRDSDEVVLSHQGCTQFNHVFSYEEFENSFEIAPKRMIW